MRVPLEWLHEYCEPHLDAGTLAQRLALTGTEVERVEHHGVLAVENFVVGHVLERKKHPDADRLNVCMVDIGGSTPSQIVCGAPNVAAGQTVGVARPGAVMPDGTKLKKAKLRGVESQGMIVSERELQISEDHDRDHGARGWDRAGHPARAGVQIATDVLVLEITPNRPDCLGIYGVAREVAATTGAQLKPAPWEQDPGSFGELDGHRDHQRGRRRAVPAFHRSDLRRDQARSEPAVDEGAADGLRPAADLERRRRHQLRDAADRAADARVRLRPRRRPPPERPARRAGEQIQTLDDQTRTLDEDIVLIEDADGPTSIAGMMGGARSEVSDATTTVVSEVATWNGPNIHATGAEAGVAQ